MSVNKNMEAESLRKEIAYLSGLIDSAKTKSNLQKYDHKVTSATTMSSRSQYCHNRTFHQHNNFVPFPKSSKYIASSSQSETTPYEIFHNRPKYATSKGILSKSASCPVLANNKYIKLKESTMCSSQDTNSQSVQDNILPQSTYNGASRSNFPTNSHIRINSGLDEMNCTNMHVNPKFLKNIPSSSSSSSSNVPVVKELSTIMNVPKQSHSVTSKSTIVPKKSKQSCNSSVQDCRNIASQIQALRKSLGYEVPPLTKPVLPSNKPDIQKQIMDLRKTLGYEIPSTPPKETGNRSTEEQIRQLRVSMGYDIPNENSNRRERNLKSKSHSDPYHYSPKSSPVKSESSYEMDKKDSCAKLKISFNHDPCQKLSSRSRTSKYVINRKNTPKRLSPKIIKSRFKLIVKSQAKETPSKMTGSSTTQKAAKTIISKYKIRKITDTNKSKFSHNQIVTSLNLKSLVQNSWAVKDKKPPTFSPAYISKGNVYSWRRLSHSSFNPFHHKNMLRPHQSFKTDGRGNSQLVFINGFLYKTTGKSLLKTGSKKVDNRKNRCSTSSWNRKKPIIIKKVNGKETKTVQVRGVTFEMASNGHSLKRIDTSTGERKSQEKTNRVTRIDLHGVTYIQTKPGTLVKMDTLRTRALTSRAINKSINTIITNKQRKKVNKQYCIYYNRFGKCNRGTSCQFLHDPEKIAVCTRFLRGTCKVKDCLFSHQVSQDKMPVCSYFLKGRCDKDDCPYLHVKVSQNAAICLSFINGYCPNGKECKKLHTRICPEFSQTGKCKSGNQCQLEHKRKKVMRRKSSSSSKEASSVTTIEDNPTVEDSKTNTSKLPSYISLVEYGSPYIPSNTNQRFTPIPIDQDESLHIKPRL